MLQRQDACLLVGALVILLGGALFLNLFSNEPLWVEWVLGPLLVALGLIVAIVGVVLRCNVADAAAGEAQTNAAAVAKPIR